MKKFQCGEIKQYKVHHIMRNESSAEEWVHGISSVQSTK